MLRATLWATLATLGAAIASLALYSVLSEYMFPFAALAVFAILVLSLTLYLEETYYSWEQMDKKAAANETDA
jgi:hypothetical protein